MDLKDSAPRLFMVKSEASVPLNLQVTLPAFGPRGSPTTQVIEGDFSPELLEAARGLGLQIKVVPAGIESRAPRGYVVGATIGEDGKRRAAATTLLSGLALSH